MKHLIIAILVFAVVILWGYAQLSTDFTCAACGREVNGYPHTSNYFGEEIVQCDDCYGSYHYITNFWKDILGVK